MPWNYRWRSHPAVERSEQDINELRADNVRLRREVKTKQSHLRRLKILVQQRSDVIDDLRGKLEQLQARNRQLDEEAERYAEMVRFGALEPGRIEPGPNGKR